MSLDTVFIVSDYNYTMELYALVYVRLTVSPYKFFLWSQQLTGSVIFGNRKCR
jgi:hypothetical protein